MSVSLPTFMNAHRTTGTDWNLTGMNKGVDTGKYLVGDEEYGQFLSIFNNHVFGTPPRSSSLLERPREKGPILVDLDLHYEVGGPLVRRFTPDDVRDFIAEYVAAMIYFSKVESLTEDLYFYHLEKPAPEVEKKDSGSFHKDGVHIQCPSITLSPKYQYGIRGYLLSRDIIQRLFGRSGEEAEEESKSELINSAEDIYDVSVIHRNNWFLYGASKPNKTQYRIIKIWHIAIADIAAALDGGDPTDVAELTEIVKEIMTESVVPTNTLEIINTLSIRNGHKEASPLSIRHVRGSEWEELMINWGAGSKTKMDRLPAPRNVHEFESDALVVAAGGAGAVAADGATLIDSEENCRVTSAVTPEDIKLAHRLCRECINPERRAGEYHDWINVAICLKNISNTDESFQVWCDVTRRVDSSHKKARLSDAELRAKWNLVRIDASRKLGMGSLQYWSNEDSPDRYRSILSETHTDWILNFARLTHVSVASFVCRYYKQEFRCCIGARKGSYEWYQYAPGSHAWKHMRTPVELRARLSSQIVAQYWDAEKKAGDRMHSMESKDQKEVWDAKKKSLSKIQRELEMKSFKDCVLTECQEKFYDDEFISKLNASPFTIGVANGVLDLRFYDNEAMTGRPRVFFRQGCPEDNISFQMGRSDPDFDAIPWTPYNPSDPIQIELAAFFERIYPDIVLREYVLTLLASCLEGQNKEQKFYVMQGPGSNGKSMIEKLMEWTFGDYGTSLSTTVFTRKRPDSGAANPDIITVKCRRYIHMGEPDDSERINTSIMKQYSGGDAVPARGLFSDQEKFSIMGKIFMSCNDLPPVNKMDNGTWRRIRVIPHVSVFKDPGDASIDPSKHIYEKDLDLENKLRHWRSGFLSLLVHYYDKHYIVHGLKEPACVSEASDNYKKENDQFTQFFGECFAKDPAGVVYAKDVRSIFRQWKRTQGRGCELKELQVLERMKSACGSGSTEREFYGIRVADESEDLSGALISHT